MNTDDIAALSYSEIKELLEEESERHVEDDFDDLDFND